MRSMAQANSLAYYHSCERERLARGECHERELQVLQKIAISDHPRRLLCIRCNAAGTQSPKMSQRSRTAARRAIALISIWRTTLGSP